MVKGAQLVTTEVTLTPQMVKEALDQFALFIKRKGLKATRQREDILQTFLSTNEHISAEDLYQMVAKQDKGIGFATVYRTLHLIVESGIAREREFSAGRKLYEHVLGESSHHHHIICTQCTKIVEFICPDIVERAQEETAKQFGFQLTGHTHELYGICAECQRRAARL